MSSSINDPITLQNFPITSAQTLKVIDQFGDAGRELLTNSIWPGLVLETNATYAKVDGTQIMSPEGKLKFDTDFSSKPQSEYRTKRDSLMTFLLGKLSPESYACVSSDPSFILARSEVNTLQIWRLIVKTHLCGTSISNKIHTL